MLQTKRVKEIKTNILCYVTVFSRKSCRMENCGTAGQATDDNTAHAHCMLDNLGHKHTLTTCNTHCFSTTTMVARTQLNVTLYVHRLSCLIFFLISNQ